MMNNSNLPQDSLRRGWESIKLKPNKEVLAKSSYCSQSRTSENCFCYRVFGSNPIQVLKSSVKYQLLGHKLKQGPQDDWMRRPKVDKHLYF